MKFICEGMPERDGEYYVMTCNAQEDRTDFGKAELKNGEWMLPEEDSVLFWEEIIPHSEEDDIEWIDENIGLLEKEFGSSSAPAGCRSRGFAVACGMLECIVEYDWFCYSGYARKIGDRYVIQVV